MCVGCVPGLLDVVLLQHHLELHPLLHTPTHHTKVTTPLLSNTKVYNPRLDGTCVRVSYRDRGRLSRQHAQQPDSKKKRAHLHERVVSQVHVVVNLQAGVVLQGQRTRRKSETTAANGRHGEEWSVTGTHLPHQGEARVEARLLHLHQSVRHGTRSVTLIGCPEEWGAGIMRAIRTSVTHAWNHLYASATPLTSLSICLMPMPHSALTTLYNVTDVPASNPITRY